jgi:hypothetical protein
MGSIIKAATTLYTLTIYAVQDLGDLIASLSYTLDTPEKRCLMPTIRGLIPGMQC